MGPLEPMFQFPLISLPADYPFPQTTAGREDFLYLGLITIKPCSSRRKQECVLEVQTSKFLRQLPAAVAFFSIKTLIKMPNGAEKKCQAMDNRLRNAFLENIPEKLIVFS